jgi:hypothetical protein
MIAEKIRCFYIREGIASSPVKRPGMRENVAEILLY